MPSPRGPAHNGATHHDDDQPHNEPGQRSWELGDRTTPTWGEVGDPHGDQEPAKPKPDQTGVPYQPLYRPC